MTDAPAKFARKPIGIPDKLVKAVMAAQTDWTFPWLEGVIECPALRPDGTIISKPGYDEVTGLFYDHRDAPKIPEIKDSPTPQDAIAALKVIEDVISEFKFDGEQSRSVAVAAILSGVARRTLTMCPAFLIDAPGQSNGKTLLADLIATIPTGRGAGATQWPHNDEEQQKRIASILVEGDLVVNFDNVVGAIGGGAICGMLTAQANFKTRLLSKNVMLSLPTNVLVLFTGNNMVVKDDMATRVVRIRLDAGVEHPELIEFKRKDLLAYVREKRGDLIHACLTILRAYRVAGFPLRTIGGKEFKVPSRFNDWGRQVGGVIVWLGLKNPMLSQEGVIADDPIRSARAAIMREWRDSFPGVWVTAKDLIRRDAIIEAVNDLDAKGGNSSGAIAGKLKTFEGVIIDGHKIVRRKATHDRATAWAVVEKDADKADMQALKNYTPPASKPPGRHMLDEAEDDFTA